MIKATIIYYKENAEFRLGERVSWEFNSLTPYESRIFIDRDSIFEGVIKVSGTLPEKIRELTEIVAGVFEDDSNFFEMVKRRAGIPIKETGRLDIVFNNGKTIHVKKGKEADEILKAYFDLTLLEGTGTEVDA